MKAPTENHSPTQAGHHIDVTDGRKPLGTIVEHNGEHRAYDAAGALVGVFQTRASARLALVARGAA